MVPLGGVGVEGSGRPGTSGEMVRGRRGSPALRLLLLEGFLTGLVEAGRGRPPRERLRWQGPVRRSGRGQDLRRAGLGV